MQLADSFQVYDAAYLELASRRVLLLATLDRDLLDASAALGIALLGVHQRIKRHASRMLEGGSGLSVEEKFIGSARPLSDHFADYQESRRRR